MVEEGASRSDVEQWFLRAGAPWVVRGSGSQTVLTRMLPLSVLLSSFILPTVLLQETLLGGVDENADPTPEESTLVLISIVVPALIAVAVLVIFLRVRRRYGWLRTPTAGIVGAGLVLLLTAAANLPWGEVGATVEDLLIVVPVLIGGYLVVLSGFGAFVAWAFRRMVIRLVPLLLLVSRAIPPLLLLVAFLFINAEAWQLSSNLDRTRIWGVVAFLLAMILLFLAFRLPREISQLEVDVDHDEVATACERTPLSSWAETLRATSTDHSPEPTPLRPRERLNMIGLLLAAQLIQIVFLAAAVFVLFWLFGALAVSDVTIEQWIGRPPTPGTALGLPIAVSVELLKVCVLISTLSALYFSVYTLTDSVYRAEFLEELLGEIRELLLARECYLRTLGPS